MPEEYAVDGTILSYCAKCKAGLDHTIVTMAKDSAEQVQCSACGNTHKFKDPAVAQKVRVPRAKKASARPPGELALWENGIRKATGKEQVYTMGAKYSVGDIILHDTFGKGVVIKLYQSKCDVMFEDKKRLMASAN